MINFPAPATEGQFYNDQYGKGWVFTDGRWLPSTSGRKFTIGELDDVSTSSSAENYVLKYNGSKFISQLEPAPTLPEDHRNYPVKRYPFRVHMKPQYMSHNYDTLASFTEVKFDPENIYEAGSKQVRIPVTGLWRFTTRIGCKMGDNNCERTNITLRVNGVTRHAMAHQFAGDYDPKEIYLPCATVITPLNAGDTVRVYSFCTHDNGSSSYFYDKHYYVTQELTCNSSNDSFTSLSLNNRAFPVGKEFEVVGTPNNDGIYTVRTSSYNSVYVNESITHQNVTNNDCTFHATANPNTEFSGYLDRNL